MWLRAGLARLGVAVLILCAVSTAAPSFATSSTPAHKAKKSTSPASKTAIYASIVVDADTGQVLHEANADTQSYPASLTKMMTLYLLFGALERGEVRMTTPLQVSAYAASQAPSKLNVQPRKAITVDQAIDAIVTLSANDVAVVIAENLGGTEAKFAERMTTTAHKIGMTNTFFHNASGLPDPQQLSTARDMAILAKHLIHDHPEYYGLFSRMDFTYNGRAIHTHNHLLEYYDGADGIKTGYTVASGYNLVSSAKRDNHRLIAVVFGGATAQARDHHMVDLLDDGFAALSGQPVTAVANRIEEFQKMNVADAHPTTESEAESAGDREENYKVPTSITEIIEASELPPVSVASSDVAPMPAPKLAVLPANNPKPALAIPDDPSEAQSGMQMASREPSVSESVLKTAPPGSWGIQIGAFSSEVLANAQARNAAGALKTEFADAVPVVEAATVNGKKFYRAQIRGLSQKDLMKACALVTVQPKTSCKALAPEIRKVAAG